ncbi:nonstructural protein 1 [Bovine rotavirus C]|uniref:Non-structural protein 1 n=1 Tax=Bovine rotavirus C TaxID=31588 RepID=A0A060NIC2_9REOV|nr:nonstructural protein 1 [Bovine rotavirus C]
MASSYREMLYWFGKNVDRKLPSVNTNGWRKRRSKKDGVCLNCLDECRLSVCDACGIKHVCENCILSECFLEAKNEFNIYRWLSFDDEPSQMVLIESWIAYKNYFLTKFNYKYSTQAKILDMNKNQKFQLNEGRKQALSVPITTQYFKFSLFGKIHIHFGTILTNKIQPWLQLSELNIGYLQSLNIDRCAELLATKGSFAVNVMRTACITKIACKRPISEGDYIVEAYLEKDGWIMEWKFAAVIGRKKIPVPQSLAMKYFLKSIDTELFYYAHSRCHPLSACPRWNQGLRIFSVSTIDIVFRRQFMNEIVEWFELLSQYIGVHYDFITNCICDESAIAMFKKEIEEYIENGKKITLSSIIPEEHAAFRHILNLRKSLMLAIDMALLRIRSQSMGVL